MTASDAEAEAGGGAVGAAGAHEEQLLTHLRRAGELTGARRLPEAELELLRALSLAPRDLRALELLALVRFRLGRLTEAREVYRTARTVAPENPVLRLNLGLIALELDWFEEAVTELEEATRLAPADQRAWSYLGYAHARLGARARAAEAFRRANLPELAEELEQRPAGPPARMPRMTPLSPGGPIDAGGAGGAGPAAAPAREPFASLAGFATERLLPDQRVPDQIAGAVPGGVLRLTIQREAHVLQAALLATVGNLRVDEARRRRRGRLTDEGLGQPAAPFVRCVGEGELWLTVPASGHGLLALLLDDDVLYLREERVVCFDGDVVWESGQIPMDGLALLQFRGSGRVVVDAGGAELVALRVPEGELVTVARARLVGWVGRIVAQSVRTGATGGELRGRHIACEGEGVLLLSRHGQSSQPVHEHPQPGDHGAGPADPGRPVLHR